MARIAYPARGAFPADLARTLDAMPRHAPIEMLAHSPLLAQRFLQLGQVQLGALELSPRNRELLILHVAAKVGCEYEYRQHIPISEAAGVEPDLREAIWSGELDTAALPDDERALLAFIDAVLRSPQVDEAEVTAVRRQFSDREIVEILQLVGFYWGFGRLCTVLDVEIDEPDGLTSLNSLLDLGAGE